MRKAQFVLIVSMLAILASPAFVFCAAIPILEITSPTNTQYTYLTDFTQGVGAGFGEVTSFLQYVNKSMSDSDYANFGDKNIALIERGTNTFYEKAFRAQTFGAVGVIVYNNTDGIITPTAAGFPPVTIPLLFTTKDIGVALLDMLSEGAVEVHMLTVQNPPSPVPEPSTMLLMGSGLAGLVGYGRRRHKL